MTIIETLAQFEDKGAIYKIDLGNDSSGKPCVQVFADGKPYGKPYPIDEKTYFNGMTVDARNFFADIVNMVRPDITGGLAERVQAALKRKNA